MSASSASTSPTSTSPASGGGNRLLEVAAAQRQELESAFERLEAGAPGPERRQQVDLVVEQLARHTAARRQLLYPRVVRDVPDGDAVVDLAGIGQDQIERTSRELASVPDTAPTFEPLVAKLVAEAREHLDDEQAELLPQLVDAIGVAAADELGEELARTDAGGA